MDNPLDFLSAPADEADQPRVDNTAPDPQAPTEPQEAPTGRERDEAGRFAAKSADDPTEAASEPGDAEKPLTKRELNGVLSKALDERDKRQEAVKRAEAAEQRADTLEKQLAEMQAQGSPRTVTAEERMMKELADLRANQNRLEAVAAHGKEKVTADFEWATKRCDEDPVFNSRAMALIQSNGNPYEVAVALRKEADQLDALKNPPAATAEPAPPIAEPVVIPKSLANAPGNGAVGKPHVPTGPGAAYDALGLQ